MPKVDMDMAAGTLAVWHVAEGETVVAGAPLFDIETEKAAMEVEAPATGRLLHVIAAPGARIDVGAPVAWIYGEDEAVGDRPGIEVVPLPAAKPVETQPPQPAPEAASKDADRPPRRRTVEPVERFGGAGPAEPTGARYERPEEAEPDKLRATPAARRLAREAGFALDGRTGSGPRGRLQARDIAPDRPAVPALGLHVSRRAGTGAPLLLLHGFAADSAGWAPFERALPPDLPLLRIDLPAHGNSPRTPLRGFPDLLRALTRAFDDATDGPVHLLGHSLGGGLALGLADIRPRRIASLTLLAPAGLGPEIDGAALAGIARATQAESLAPWLKRLTATPDGVSWDFVRAAMRARTDPELRDAQVALAGALFPDGTQAFDLRAALARVDAPTAIVWGRDDAILPWRQALAAPGESALHLLHGIGHLPHVECPDRLAGIVARHIGRTPRC